MRPRLGLKAAGALWLLGAGCAPALQGTGPGSPWEPGGGGAVLVAGPACALRAADANFPTIECREADAPSPPALPRMPVPIASWSRPRPIDAAGFRRSPFDEAADALAPDPFAEAGAKKICACAPAVAGEAEDVLAPDPFAERKLEKMLRRGRPLAEDDLAPDPFAGPQHEAKVRARKPLAEDDLAPDPFASAR